MSVVLRDVDKFKTSFADFSNVHGVVVKSRSVACVLSAVGVTLGDLNAAREILLSDLKCCQEELQKSRDRISELESTCCRSLPDTDNDWQLRNAQLEEKCELLREELERQREFIQRNRASHDTSSLVACLDGTTTPSCCLDAGENSDNVPPSRQQAMTESDVRQLRVKLDALERDNMQLKRECEQNCATIAQYNREMELLRAKERVQLSVEYVRNVILQYLCCSREEVRTKMIPAIAAVLDFTPKEKMDVQSANPTCPRFF
ncbi:GRIP domain [Trypanosoma vivax]|nr:GRIP domain [Trypanosoma vivax]